MPEIAPIWPHTAEEHSIAALGINITDAENDVTTLLGVDRDSLTATYAKQRLTHDYRTRAMVRNVSQEVLYEALFRAKSGITDLSEDDLKAILEKTRRSWVFQDYHPEVSRHEFYGNEQLCSLLMKMVYLGVEGYKSGLWRRT